MAVARAGFLTVFGKTAMTKSVNRTRVTASLKIEGLGDSGSVQITDDDPPCRRSADGITKTCKERNENGRICVE